MASYMVLGNYTDEGMRNIKDSPNRLAAVRQAVEGAGGRLIFFNVRTTTLKAFTEDEYQNIVASL